MCCDVNPLLDMCIEAGGSEEDVLEYIHRKIPEHKSIIKHILEACPTIYPMNGHSIEDITPEIEQDLKDINSRLAHIFGFTDAFKIIEYAKEYIECLKENR